MRLAVLLVAMGGALSCLGAKEFSLCCGTSAQPVYVHLAQLEAGRAPPSNYLRIGPHIAIFPAAVYRYRCQEGTGRAAADASLLACYYPIVSSSHPFVLRLEQLQQRYGDLSRAARHTSLPELKQFAVLVKTARFGCPRHIPAGVQHHTGLCGMVINRVESLGPEEQQFLHASFPELQLDRVLIVEEGRTPSSVASCLAMMGSGVLLVLAGVRLFWCRAVGSL